MFEVCDLACKIEFVKIMLLRRNFSLQLYSRVFANFHEMQQHAEQDVKDLGMCRTLLVENRDRNCLPKIDRFLLFTKVFVIFAHLLVPFK